MDDNIKWTIDTYAVHNEALRKADAKFQEERDRRYSEVARVREVAHDEALQLAREIQKYKDEKANELREQINQERLLYVRKSEIKAMESKFESTLKPVLEFVASQQGREKGVDKTLYYVIALIGVSIGIISLLVAY